MALLSQTLAANGSTAEIQSTTGSLFLSVRGDFGTPAGTVTLQYKLADATWVDIDVAIVAVISVAGDVLIGNFPPGLRLRLTLAGATGPDLDILLHV